MEISTVFNCVKDHIEAIKRASNDSYIEDSLDSEWSFFERFCETLFETAFNNNEEQMRVLSLMSQAKTYNERVRVIFENESLKKLTEVLLDEFCKQRQCGKDEVKSNEMRTEGNKFYAQGKFQEALDKYNQAIDLAPYPNNEEEKELAFCLGNRSAAFFHLRQYHDSLQDIKEAILLNYPIDRIHILTERILQCFEFIQASKSVKEQLQELKQCLDNKESELMLKEKIINMSLKNDNKCINTVKRTPNTTISEKHINIANASNAIRVSYSSDKGRFVEADKDILPSEVLFTEKPFVQWLKPSHYKIFCCHCFKHLVYSRFVACKHCSEVRYCSGECRKIAWEQYHKLECDFNHILKYLSLGSMALKAVLIVNTDVALQLSKEEIEPPNKSITKQYNGDYKSILSLVEHADKSKPNVVASMTTGAVFLALLGRNMKIIDVERVEQLASLILQHIFQFNSNAIAVLFDECEKSIGYQTFNANVKPIGMAIYPTICLLNHSCYTQLYVLFNASHITLKAVGDIKNGEEISFCYGPHYQKITFKDRNEILNKCFYFNCQCKACANKWENLGRAFLCTNCNEGPVIINDDKTNYCLSCNGSNSNISLICQAVNQIRGLLTEGYSYIDNNEGNEESVLKASRKYIEALILGQKFLYKTNDLMIETNEKLADCYSQIGKHKKAMVFWFKCYELTKEVEKDDCNYDCLFYLLKITEAIITDTYSLTERKDTPKISSNVKKASSYFAKAVEVSQKLSGREYKLLVARNEILQNVPVLEEVATNLHQLNVLFNN